MPILICKFFNKKVIYTPYYADETVLPIIVKKIFDFLIAGWSFRMATRIIVLTSTEKDILIRKFKIEPKNVSIIPSGIDMGEYGNDPWTEEKKTQSLSRNGINNKRRNIIVVARIARNKGHIYLIEAFEGIPNCNLIIVGKDWGEKANLVKYIHEKNISNVYFLENIDNIEKNNLLKSSDVLVLPSLGGESFGIVLLEAMANGLPVVASNVGGVKDLIHEGLNGYLVEPRNVQQIKEKVDAILFDKNIESMKRYCRDFVSRYDWGKIYGKINDLYQDVLSNNIDDPI
jgi:glycosyltransferase involved in cell wall biosynthesis